MLSVNSCGAYPYPLILIFFFGCTHSVTRYNNELQRSNARILEAFLQRNGEKEGRLFNIITSMGERMAERDRLLAVSLEEGSWRNNETQK